MAGCPSTSATAYAYVLQFEALLASEHGGVLRRSRTARAQGSGLEDVMRHHLSSDEVSRRPWSTYLDDCVHPCIATAYPITAYPVQDERCAHTRTGRGAVTTTGPRANANW